MKPYRNTAFLIELLVNVLVLSISCAVLVMVLVDAGLTVRSTSRKNAAGNEISSLMETARVRGLEAIAGEQTGDGFVLYYDEEWQPAANGEHFFELAFTVDEEATGAGVLQHLSATAKTRSDDEVCSFMTSLYKPFGGPNGGADGPLSEEVGAA